MKEGFGIFTLSSGAKYEGFLITFLELFFFINFSIKFIKGNGKLLSQNFKKKLDIFSNLKNLINSIKQKDKMEG